MAVERIKIEIELNEYVTKTHCGEGWGGHYCRFILGGSCSPYCKLFEKDLKNDANCSKRLPECIAAIYQKGVRKRKINLDRICSNCHGTGIRGARIDKNGVGIICCDCKGTGYHYFEHVFEEGKKRKPVEGLKRIFERRPYFYPGQKDIALEEYGGMSIQDWESGMPFIGRGREDRKHKCPTWWRRLAGERFNMPFECSWNCKDIGTLDGCSHFPRKEKCWERFDEESTADAKPPSPLSINGSFFHPRKEARVCRQ